MMIALFFNLASGYLYCIDPECSACSQGIPYRNIMCLDKCPYPNPPESDLCSESDKYLFGYSFYNFKDFSANHIDNLYTPDNLPFSNQLRTGPIPTFDQGFYFTANSSLIETSSIIFPPDFTFFVAGIIKSPGLIFQIQSDNLAYFTVYVTADSAVGEFLVMNGNLSEICSVSISYNKTSWNSLIFKIVHRPNNIVSLTASSLSDFVTKNFSNIEFQPSLNPSKFIYGSQTSSGFQGFLLQTLLKLGTENPYTYFEFRDRCLCDYNQYCDENYNCTNCNISCPTWPWCIRSLCWPCYSPLCEVCTDYSYMSCSKCSVPSLTAPDCSCLLHCLSCTKTFDCTSCEPGYELIKGICIILPYNYNSTSNSAVIDYTFNTFEQYKADVFQSGSNDLTYYPYSQEDDDPIILQYRGVYFDDTMFLQSRNGVRLSLNYNFTVAAWIFNKITINFESFIYKENGVSKIQLVGADLSQSILTRAITSNIEGWYFQSYLVNFIDGVFTISIIIGDSVIFRGSELDFIYMPSGATVIINSENYGFLHSLLIYQDYVMVYKSYKLDEFRLACEAITYFNPFIKSCDYCDGNSYCANFGTNNLCKYVECDTCLGFEDECTKGNSSYCLTGLILVDGNCCHATCNGCIDSNNFACLGCYSPQKLLGLTCVNTCPTGFTENGEKCEKQFSAIIRIKFSQILFNFTDLTQTVQIQAGDQDTTFPNLNPTHPIPSYLRGFYFHQTSYLTTSPIIANYNFTLSFFINIKADGILLALDSTILKISGLMIEYLNSVSSSLFNYNFYSKDTWHYISLVKYGDIKYVTKICLRIDSLPSFCWFHSRIVLNNNPVNVVIGSSSQSFVGFIWQFEFYNNFENLFSPVILCDSLISTNCLMNCQQNEYLENGICQTCDTMCPFGCRRGNFCELCEDRLCLDCIDYEYGCVKCKTNSYLNATQCVCNDRHFFNEISSSCEPCMNNCESCTSLSTCECFEHSHNENLNCVCDEGYWLANDTCLLCHSLCFGCTLNKYYRCTSCFNFLLNSVCVNSCPIGYKEENNVCIRDESELSLRFRFDRLDGNFLDSINKIKFFSGLRGDFYPNLDSKDPWPAYKRGLYFSGNGEYGIFPFSSKNYILGLEFSICFWVNFYSIPSRILSVSENADYKLSVLVFDDQIVIKILLETEYLYSLTVETNKEQWVFLMASVKYDLTTSVSISLDKVVGDWKIMSEIPFNSTKKAIFRIGMIPEDNLIFKGFIHEISIFTVPQDPFNYFNSYSYDCSSQHYNLSCIPNCDIFSYPENSECEKCNYSCTKGCRSNITCNLCHDINCDHCVNYNEGTCTLCKSGFNLYSGRCGENCSSFEFFNIDLFECEKCLDLCEMCENNFTCITCLANSTLTEKNVCECDFGYRKEQFCVRKTFFLVVAVEADNQIKIIFNETLKSKLKNSSISIKINLVSQKFSIIKQSEAICKVLIEFVTDIFNGDKLLIEFNEEIVSSVNALLSTTQLNSILFSYSIDSESKEIKNIRKTTSITMTVASSAMAFISLLNLDINSFLNLRNSIEMFSSIALYDIDFDEIVLAFLSQVHQSNMLPSIMDLAIETPHRNNLPKKFINYGYKSNSILLNSGMFYLTLLFTASFYIVIKLLNTLINDNITGKILKKIEFDAFFKVWTQGYLEICICSILGIVYSNVSNALQFLEVTLCFFSLAFNFAGIGGVVYLIRKKTSIKEESEKKEFLDKFGFFFNEFHPDKYCLFYLIFIVRRFFVILVYLIIPQIVFQILLLIIFSLMNFFYLVSTKCYIDRFNGGFVVFSELVTFLFYWLILLKFIGKFELSSYCFIYCVFIILFSSTVFGLAKLFTQIFYWVKNRRQKMNVVVEDNTTDFGNIWIKRTNTKLNSLK